MNQPGFHQFMSRVPVFFLFSSFHSTMASRTLRWKDAVAWVGSKWSLDGLVPNASEMVNSCQCGLTPPKKGSTLKLRNYGVIRGSHEALSFRESMDLMLSQRQLWVHSGEFKRGTPKTILILVHKKYWYKFNGAVFQTWFQTTFLLLDFLTTIFFSIGGGFKYFLFSSLFWGRFPIWLIFFNWVETTN